MSNEKWLAGKSFFGSSGNYTPKVSAGDSARVLFFMNLSGAYDGYTGQERAYADAARAADCVNFLSSHRDLSVVEVVSKSRSLARAACDEATETPADKRLRLYDDNYAHAGDAVHKELRAIVSLYREDELYWRDQSLSLRDANDALRATNEKLREALIELRDWYALDPLAMTPLDQWEKLANEFHCETGMLRPGKDLSAAANESEAATVEREKAWFRWYEVRKQTMAGRIRSALASTESAS